jgi:diketogulonate reductase-like aldo/keto reductase
MGNHEQLERIRMESAVIPGAGLEVSRVGLGTWAIGGWMWGGTDESTAIRTLRTALDQIERHLGAPLTQALPRA